MSATWDKIVLFGDSITQDSFNQQRGFAFSAGLQHEYIRRLDVINRGFSGYTTRQALKVLPHVVPSPSTANIRLFVIFLGANDASRPEAENKQHVPLDEYASNLEKIISHPSVTAHNPKILLIAPAPIEEHLVWFNEKSLGRAAVSRKNADVKKYAEAAVAVGQRLGVPVVNLWTAFMSSTGWKEQEWKENEPIVGSLDVPQNEELVRLMHDGLHFNPAGYQALLEEFLSVVRETVPELAPENVPMKLPIWNDAEAWESWDASHSPWPRYSTLAVIPHPGRAVCGDDAAVRAGSVPVVEEGRQAYEQVEACENLVMDPESAAFQPRDDFWQMQDDMLRMHQTQAELADRVSRLERRNEDDTRLKNVWGGTSPFPSVLGGTPQQVPLQQPTADRFSTFDDHSSALINDLQLDADEEPRRLGTTSRANSVRFDETANHGHWSRPSTDFITRTGSGMGGHPMSERSYSHRSLGGQSSAGQSVHSATSGRANSLTGYGVNVPEAPGLAPGLFILGSVPAIIRCWLTTTFKHDTMLYAAVCSGSYASFLDLRLINKLGFQDQIVTTDDGRRTIKLPMYLPEAVPVSASSHASSPAPQLPSLTVDFTVVENYNEEAGSKAVQIFLGSDMLRAHNADVLLSSNQLTLYDDDHSKLRIPLVRPEDEQTFKSLYITSGPQRSVPSQATAEKLTPQATKALSSKEPQDVLLAGFQNTSTSTCTGFTGSATTSSSDDGSVGRRSLEQRPRLGHSMNSQTDFKEAQESSPGVAARSGSSPAIWSNWRRDTDKSGTTDWAKVGKTPAPTYQRRDTGIKVLKKPGARTASASLSHGSSPSITGQSRFFDDGKRREETPGEAVSGEKAKENAALAKTRSANPVGGASAFPWLNAGGSK